MSPLEEGDVALVGRSVRGRSRREEHVDRRQLGSVAVGPRERVGPLGELRGARGTTVHLRRLCRLHEQPPRKVAVQRLHLLCLRDEKVDRRLVLELAHECSTALELHLGPCLGGRG